MTRFNILTIPCALLLALLLPSPVDARMDQKCDDEIEIQSRDHPRDYEARIRIASKCISKEPYDEFYRHVKGLAEYGLGKIDEAIATLQDTLDMQNQRNTEANRPEESRLIRQGMTYWILATFRTYKELYGDSSPENNSELRKLPVMLVKTAGCRNLEKTDAGVDIFLNQDERSAICLDAIHIMAWLRMNDGDISSGCEIISAWSNQEYELALSPIRPGELHSKCS